jgi:hypothetical protein
LIVILTLELINSKQRVVGAITNGTLAMEELFFMWTYPSQRISTLAMEELFLCGLIQAKESARTPLDGI